MDRDRLPDISLASPYDCNHQFNKLGAIQWCWDNCFTVSPEEQTSVWCFPLFCIHSQLIRILESWCHMVMRSCPLRCQFHNFTKAATDTIYHRDSHQRATVVARSSKKPWSVSKSPKRRHQTAPAGTASAAREEFHQTFHQRSGARQRAVPPPALTGRLTGGEEPPGGRGGRGAVLARLSTIPDNANKLFLRFRK